MWIYVASYSLEQDISSFSLFVNVSLPYSMNWLSEMFFDMTSYKYRTMSDWIIQDGNQQTHLDLQTDKALFLPHQEVKKWLELICQE